MELLRYYNEYSCVLPWSELQPFGRQSLLFPATSTQTIRRNIREGLNRLRRFGGLTN